MPIAVTINQILQLAPNARSSYREAFQNGQPVLDGAGISDTSLRVAHFLAQVLYESGGLAIQFENLNYSAERLPVVWPLRFKPRGPLNPNDYAFEPEKLANAVYGGRMGNTEPGDGYRYRGRGLLQLTGKGTYQTAMQRLRATYPDAPDLVANPDEVISATWCLAIAAAEWTARGCNALADQDDIGEVTRAINGANTGLSDRTEWLRRTKAMWLGRTVRGRASPSRRKIVSRGRRR